MGEVTELLVNKATIKLCPEDEPVPLETPEINKPVASSVALRNESPASGTVPASSESTLT